MRVLVACEYSGRVREAFAAKGHDAWSCDLLETEQPGQHIQGDVLELLDGSWDLVIAHPPCTYLANSGVRWLKDPGRWELMLEGARFFRRFLYCAPRVCIENPIMHGNGQRAVGCKPSQIIQPYQHGHGETKATCLWLRNLPLLMPSNEVSGREQRVHLLPPGPDRWKERSRTFEGIALAMAEQWG